MNYEAFLDGFVDELEKRAGWRDLGLGRIAKMKARMGESLKSVRSEAKKSLKATGQTGTPLYSVGERGETGGKFYKSMAGDYAARNRDPARREGPKFQGRIQEAIRGRIKPSGPSVGERMKAWGAGIKSKITGAARGAKQQIAGAGGAIAGAARGAAQGAVAGRAAAMAPSILTTATKISKRAKPPAVNVGDVAEAA